MNVRIRLTTESSIDRPQKLPCWFLLTPRPVVAELARTSAVFGGMAHSTSATPSAGGAGAVNSVLSATPVEEDAAVEVAVPTD